MDDIINIKEKERKKQCLVVRAHMHKVALSDIIKFVMIQELSPVLFTLLKSTEPFLDEYYLLDLEETLRRAGFVNVTTMLTDPRHRTVTATVPF